MGQFIKKISGEEPFQVPSRDFIIGPSSSGYTLAYDIDPEGDFANEWDEATAADICQVVLRAPLSAWFKLVGNTDTVDVSY